MNLGLVDRRIIYFWQVLESIHKFIIELHALQCLFVRGSSKKQRRDRIISNFTKGETFSCLISTKLEFCNVVPLRSIIAPFQKRLFFSLQFGQEENISGNSIERRDCWFILKIPRMLPVPTGRVGIGWWNYYKSYLHFYNS